MHTRPDWPLNNLHRNVQRFRGGLLFKAHRLLYYSTLGLRVTKREVNSLQVALPLNTRIAHPHGKVSALEDLGMDRLGSRHLWLTTGRESTGLVTFYRVPVGGEREQ